MKKLIMLAVFSLVLPSFYSGCLGDSHMEPATTETPPPEGVPLEGGETTTPAEGLAPVDFTLKIQSMTGGNGNVTIDYGVSPVPTCTPLDARDGLCNYTITGGTSVTLNAVGTGGYIFKKWSGDITDSVNPNTFIIEGNATIGVEFMRALEPRRDLTAPKVPEAPPAGMPVPH